MPDSVEPTIVKPGGASNGWVVVFAVWLVLVGVVYVTTDFGLPATVAGMAGLYMVYRGVRAIWQAVASRSIEQEAIGSLGGRSDPVSIEGTAHAADETLQAPMTGTESVAYRVTVEEYVPESQE